jgi:cation-transporting ATPase I
MFEQVLGTAARAATPVLESARAVIAPPGRRALSSSTHTHFEVRGVHLAGAEPAIEALERRLTELEGVSSAEVNAVLGRVSVGHDPETAGRAELAGVIAEVEREHGLDHHRSPAGELHPGKPEPVVREVGAMALSAAGIGFSAVTALLPLPGFPSGVSTAISLTESVPFLRSTVDRWLGRSLSDTVLETGSAVSHSLARSPLELFTGMTQRFCTSREAISRQQAWQRWEQKVADKPGVHRASALELEPRPVRLPDGRLEKVKNASGAVAMAGSAATFALLRSPQRAMATLSAGVPKAGTAGREAFAAQLATSLSSREALVFEPEALRRLDRVDTVVLDSAMLLTGHHRVEDVVALHEHVDPSQFFGPASALVDPTDPGARQRRGDWSVGPVADFPDLPGEVLRSIGREESVATTFLVLCHQEHPVALVRAVAEMHPLAEAVVDAARTCGSVLVAGQNTALDQRLDVDGRIAGGDRFASSVRQLQSDGHVVAVVSARARAALASADVGLGVADHNGQVPWGAHVVSRSLGDTYTFLSAVDIARDVSKNTAWLCLAGSGLGLLFGWLGPAFGAQGRASLPVQSAALFALGMGTWSGMRAAARRAPAPVERTPWHALPAETVMSMLATTEDGLSTSEAKRRTAPAETGDEQAGVLGATLRGLTGPITPVLGGGAVVSAGLGSVVDALLIMGVMAGSALVDAVHQVGTQRELDQLLDAGQLPVRVRRDGQVQTVPADQLVAGDAVELQAGDGVPADCRLVDGSGVEADESNLTGESQLVQKSEQATTAAQVADRTSMLYQGTAIATGTALAVVVATGSSTEIGRTTRDSGAAEAEPSGVEQRLTTLTKQLLPLSGGAGLGVFLVDVLRGAPIVGAVTRAVGLAVAAVPEGLPFVATVAELAAARRLSNQGVLVRSPSTIEALGRVDALCFDKTGTLTQGRISLRMVSDGAGAAEPEDLDPWQHWILETAVRASPHDDGEQPMAHPTDQAVLDGGRAAGITDHPGQSALLGELLFEPSRGYHAALWDTAEGPRVSVKGAPEVVLDACSRWRRREGATPVDARTRARLREEVERLALGGYRVLAVAERADTDHELTESDVDDLDFLGLLALADPVHPTAAEAVGRLQRAGVELMMITGDHPSTAEAIAAELDMLDGRRVITGAELDSLDDAELAADLPKIAVFARVSPAQKARIVRCLRDAGRVVAMTGDGANDVPAIRLAHVGLALGSHATSAARETADLVITDDRIETITAAIVEGRGMWASVHDALSILLGGNLGEIAYALGSGLLSPSAALNARQLLVVNLFTDVLPALAIAVRPPPDATPERLLSEGPEASLGKALTRDVYLRAGATAGGAGLAWLLARPVSTPSQARTAGLVALVCTQLGQTAAMRGRTPAVLAACAGSVAALAVFVQVPGLSHFFGSSPLLPHQWGLALGSAAVTTAAVVGWQALPFGQPALPAGEQHPQLPGRQVVDGEVETPAEDSAADAAEKPQGSGASANGNGLRPASTATSGQAPRVEIPRTPWPVE